MAISIRQGTAADLAVVVEFNQRMAQETEGKTLDPAVLARGVGAVFTDPSKGPYYLAVEDNVILGQLQVTYEWSDWRAGWLWWIQSVYVRPEARRRGIFRALYDHVYQLARRQPDVIGIRLYVERDNRKAQETYRNVGMVQTPYLIFEKFPL